MRYLRFILLILLFAGCEEYFDPDIKSVQPVYGFEGYVTDEPGSYRVRVVKSIGYNSIPSFTNVPDATVYIQCMEDRYAIDYPLTYDSETGYYYTDEYAFTGQVGNSYRLKIITAEGKEFASDFEPMLENGYPIVTSEFGERRVLSSDGASYYDKLESGIQLLNSTFTWSEQSTPYYRYECKLVFQTHQHYPAIPLPFDKYIFRPYIPQGNIFIANANDYQNRMIFGNKLYFIPETDVYHKNDDVLEGMEYTLQHCGVYVRVKQYSMSKDQYLYWKALGDQLENKDYIFGKTENQPISNIKCQTDPSEPVLGYFCVSSVATAINAISLSKINKETYEYFISDFPDFETTVVYDKMPDFAVPFSN